MAWPLSPFRLAILLLLSLCGIIAQSGNSSKDYTDYDYNNTDYDYIDYVEYPEGEFRCTDGVKKISIN